jgi:subtilase family serine protease
VPRSLALLVVAVAVLATGAVSAPAAAPARRTVITAVPGRLAGARDLGRADAGQRLRVGFLLAHPRPEAEDALLRAQSNPASPDYHRFLTPAQYASRFGLTTATRRAVRRWLTSGGLRVERESRVGDYVLADGTVAQLERLTATSIHRFDRGGNAFLANTGPASVPRAIPVLQVLGLNTFQRFHTMSALDGKTQATDIGSRTPEELWSIYEQPADQTGAGVSVAILGAGKTDTVVDDLHKFDDEHHFPRLPVDVVRTPADGDYSDDSGNVEWNIDMQAIHGMAPGISKQVLYFSPTLADSELVASMATWVNDGAGPPVMNASLGECEEVPVINPILNDPALKPLNGNDGGTLPVTQAVSQNSEPATTMMLQQAVIEGRNFFAASGDNGSSCTLVYPGTNGVGNYVVPLTSDPASVPFAVGVGGTVLYSDGGTPAKRMQEYAWTHSGGNASPFIPAPAYQQDIPNLDRNCVSDPSKLCRAVPDVAALSGDVLSNGYTIVSDGVDSGGGGTSLSSPLWVGMWARILGSAPAGSSGFGFANEAFYKIARDPARYDRSFHDITAGTNGLNPAQPGYDYVTGLGVPRVSGLLHDVPEVSPARPGPAGSGGPDAPAADTPAGADTAPAGNGSAGGGCTDRTAPTARIARVSRLRLSGTASDGGCNGRVRRVSVSVARVSGTRCRFLRASGRLGPAVACSHATALTASGTTRWSLRIRGRLPRGTYRVAVRAVDAAGNTGRSVQVARHL